MGFFDTKFHIRTPSVSHEIFGLKTLQGNFVLKKHEILNLRISDSSDRRFVLSPVTLSYKVCFLGLL